MQIPQVSDEVIFIALISGIVIFVLIALLAGVVIIHHYEHRRNDKLTFSSLVGIITNFFPNSILKEEPSLSPPDALSSHSDAERESKIEPESA